MTFFHGCREITIELSQTKLASADSLPQYWNFNRDSLLNLINESLYGIQGTVSDKASGQPLSAMIEIEGHDADNSFVMTKASSGGFHRPIAPGTYTVLVSANGYENARIENVSAKDHEATLLRVELSRK